MRGTRHHWQPWQLFKIQNTHGTLTGWKTAHTAPLAALAALQDPEHTRHPDRMEDSQPAPLAALAGDPRGPPAYLHQLRGEGRGGRLHCGGESRVSLGVFFLGRTSENQ